MIKHNSKIVCIAVSAAILLTACASPESEVAAKTPEKANTEAQSAQGSSNESQGNDERRNQARPDLFGRVKSIIGNEVVLEVAEMPQRQQGEGQKSTGGSGQAPVSAPAPAMGQGQGGPPMQGQRTGIASALKFTGETITLLIPVGVPITSMSQGGSKELDIADIYTGTLLQIWYDEKDKESKNITQIRVMQGRQ